MNAEHVGEQVKRLRSNMGVSQRELARRCGLTHTTISMIENGKIDPSLGTLRSILTACGMRMSDFFRSLEADKNVFVRDEIATVSSGGVHMRYITPRRSGCQLEITQEVYDAGADTGARFIEHDGEEGGVVIRGTFELMLDGHAYTLRRGDSYYFSSRLPHRFRNIGDDEGELINAAAPPSF